MHRKLVKSPWIINLPGALIDTYYPEDEKGDRHSLYDPIEDMDLTNTLVDIVKAAVSK